ncbi:MAG: hypothetical protein KAI16_01845 [Candidatus Pacebacteria bacterium]|nr:hypothetical protein [Candidatus Paceibacterota bacterium]
MLNTQILKNMFHGRTHNFWLFESSIGLHIFASTLISAFIPTLLYRAGFSITQIILYFFLFHFFNIFFHLVVEHSVYKFGSKINIIFATFINILFFVSLALILQMNGMYSLILIAVLAALYDAFYYVTTNYVFISANQKKENIRNNTNILSIVINSASFFGPITGSFLILVFGESVLIYFVILFFIFSIIPILKLKNIQVKPEHRPVKLKAFFSNPVEIKNFMGLVCYKITQGIEWFLWPLFIYLFFNGKLEAVVLLAVLIAVSGLIFTIFNFFLNKNYQKILLIGGSLFLILSWLMRIYSDNAIIFYIAPIIASVALLSIQLPIDSNIYKRAKQIGPLAMATYKNLISMLSKAIFFGFLYIIALNTSTETVFQTAFWISILSSTFLILLSIKSNN